MDTGLGAWCGERVLAPGGAGMAPGSAHMTVGGSAGGPSCAGCMPVPPWEGAGGPTGGDLEHMLPGMRGYAYDAHMGAQSCPRDLAIIASPTVRLSLAVRSGPGWKGGEQAPGATLNSFKTPQKATWGGAVLVVFLG